MQGHGRVEAARQLGMTQVPCLCIDHLDDAQKRAYVLADNRIALNAGWDYTISGDVLYSLPAELPPGRRFVVGTRE
ncbi:ParB N-terminal domain-containing protein [Entomobacter blattae]|uniref:hypothetical protein n=1 Tax=Entomobacter blattae TaxID=2762277 RepID=UPI00193BAB80|nr:hypothetical protein [Entomobacter blattae]